MKALTYHGARDVRLETVPDANVVDADDLVLRITATAICGSDLHLYRGKVPGMEAGDILGHEFMGVVEAVGPAVKTLRPGDRVVVPFTISCGTCFFCDSGHHLPSPADLGSRRRVPAVRRKTRGVPQGGAAPGLNGARAAPAPREAGAVRGACCA